MNHYLTCPCLSVRLLTPLIVDCAMECLAMTMRECVCLTVPASLLEGNSIWQAGGSSAREIRKRWRNFPVLHLYHEKLPAQWDPGVRHHGNTAEGREGTLSTSLKLKRKIIFSKNKENWTVSLTRWSTA